ncbi:MAG: hypothetical protein J5852_05240 [Clostridia bacterium]|nr:hypothetical protein [Clostridia bacterium]
MKKSLIIISVLVSVLVIFACAFVPASANEVEKEAAPVTVDVQKARFLNMLGRNYVYGAEFENTDIIAENSILALLGCRETENSEYIEENLVIGFVNDMYGVKLNSINDNSAHHKEGYVYIAPRGFTAYRHEITDINENEDGSFTVLSEVTVTPHDDDEYTATAETLFVKNENSAFGYNIIYSNIKGEENEI